MEFYMKLPRNKKEFTLFLAIISIISVNIIAPLITCFEVGFSMKVWANTFKTMPLIWVSVIILVLLTHQPASWMKSKIIAKEDSFNAHIIVETLCTVFLMSIFLTVIGTWIGTGKISMQPIYTFFYKWPRNFAIAFAVETSIAQPIARMVMVKIHKANNINDYEMKDAN
ncbi:membrane protein [[Clostridium] sordellii]|uniref:Hypothetical membrane protein n=1 Tax=Paraclostridium sordellii TaxID=1505 RepID=A0ABM9RM99_PARSO|nr:hypothetical protein [Paeniclostridium sordellii]EPZ58964.1 hypothetical protein H477_1717 [[Clostridium] sordellii ATCC 9714] [Paeniclostridium sordellii ATCC 9714]CEJ73148.1 hypothetical membrane protein [[Clostridium] sordellii] [Paeniclostridium sordellii]CEN68701.1 membrane protein [[Clostridium] sordellii] [Paeniclostridium sordellii]CEN71968.1 membrane protein [[Clostridium] sordellii] [Paeniclostridium sordellii]CEO22790.1 membrane protein [[Clostridium] sordellii] [Paeniclostridium